MVYLFPALSARRFIPISKQYNGKQLYLDAGKNFIWLPVHYLILLT